MNDAATYARPAESTEARTSAPTGTESFERETLPYLPDVARFARSLARDASRADDLVQETFLHALRGWHTFREGSDARRWLFTICRNSYLRMMQRDRRYVGSLDGDPELESLASARAHAEAQRQGLADAAERMELRSALDRALAMLPEHYRTVVILVDVEGLGYEEAAVVLDVAIGTVRSRLFRARRLLQDQLFEFARDAQFETADRKKR